MYFKCFQYVLQKIAWRLGTCGRMNVVYKGFSVAGDLHHNRQLFWPFKGTHGPSESRLIKRHPWSNLIQIWYLILALLIIEGVSHELCSSASCCVLWCHQEPLKASTALRTSCELLAPGNTTRCYKPWGSEDVCQGWALQLPWLRMAF